MKLSYSFTLFMLIALHLYGEEESNQAILQATINVVSTSNRSDSIENYGKIMPGSKMKLSATIKNEGAAPNLPGTLYIRYIFPEPLTDQPNSLLFKTEPLAVPSITPGQEIVFTFAADQNWPSLFDFIRYDWGMRQYQAVFTINGQDKIIGTLAMLFSAYYYEGPTKGIPTEIPGVKPKVQPKNESAEYRPVVTRNAQKPLIKRHLKRSRQLQTENIAAEESRD